SPDTGTGPPPSRSKTSRRSTACRASTKSRHDSSCGCPAGGTDGNRPALGTSVTTPHSAAGHRSDPVASEPWATATAPHPTAAADPPLDPPGDRLTSHGFRVGSNPGGSVVTPFAR